MNIDELKSLWKSTLDPPGGQPQLAEHEIRTLLQRRSSSALSKINRNIVIEMIIVAVFSALIGISNFLENGRISLPLAGFLVGFVGASAAYYRYKYRVLNKVGIQHASLLQSLTSVVRHMGKFMKIYYWAMIILIPIVTLVGLFYGFLDVVQKKGMVLAEIPFIIWGILAVTAVVMTSVYMWFTRQYIRKLYGLPYEELKKCLEELEEME